MYKNDLIIQLLINFTLGKNDQGDGPETFLTLICLALRWLRTVNVRLHHKSIIIVASYYTILWVLNFEGFNFLWIWVLAICENINAEYTHATLYKCLSIAIHKNLNSRN